MSCSAAANVVVLLAVAHVREEQTGKWWRFDDGDVKLMTNGPLGEHGDHGIQSPATKEKRVSYPHCR